MLSFFLPLLSDTECSQSVSVLTLKSQHSHLYFFCLLLNNEQWVPEFFPCHQYHLVSQPTLSYKQSALKQNHLIDNKSFF